MALLTSDALSHFRRGHIYARAGAPVTIISERGTVLIVEDEKKVRFPVLRSIVSENPAIVLETPESISINPVPDPPPTKTVASVTRRKSKSVSSVQQNLF